MELKYLKGNSENLPNERNENYFYYCKDNKKIHLNDMVIEDSEQIKSELIKKIETSTILQLRAYLFNVSGTYTLSELESLFGCEITTIVEHMKYGNPLTIFSTDDVSSNISFVLESNYTLTDDGELNSLTLFWHQYQLFNTLYVTLNSNGTYTLTYEQS